MVVPNQEPNKPSKPKKSTKRNKRRARSHRVPVPDSPLALPVVHPDAAGIDVHSDMHMVCVPPTAPRTGSASSAPTPSIFRRSSRG